MSGYRIFLYPDRLEFKKGLGCLTFLGLPLSIFGIAILSTFGSAHQMEHHSSFVELLLRGWASLFFILGGAIFAFGKTGVVVNRPKKSITEWVGLFFRITTATYPLHHFERVTINHAEPSDKSKKSIFRVTIEGKDQQVDLLFSRSYAEARARAETIATFVQLDCHDRTQERTVVHTTLEHALSLREQAARSGKAFQRPATNIESSRIRYHETMDGMEFEIRPAGFHIFQILAMAAGILFCLLVLFLVVIPFARHGFGIGASQELVPFKYLILGLMIVGFVLAPLAGTIIPSLLNATARYQLLASPRGIRLKRRTFLRTTRKEIPADDLRELEITLSIRDRPSPTDTFAAVIAARSDREILEFGMGLSEEELTWFRDILRHLVTS